jgi:hypothetical protein
MIYILRLPNYGSNVTVTPGKTAWTTQIPSYLTSKGRCRVTVVEAIMQNVVHIEVGGSAETRTLIDAGESEYNPRYISNLGGFGYDGGTLALPSTLASFNTGILRVAVSGVQRQVSIPENFTMVNSGAPYSFILDSLPSEIKINRVSTSNTGATQALGFTDDDDTSHFFPCEVVLQLEFDYDNYIN